VLPGKEKEKMTVKKQYLKTKPYCKVTFRLDKKSAGGAHKVAVAGDFNAWAPHTTPMKALKSGDFTATLNLPKGRAYQYRYVIDGHLWMTDPLADKRIYCEYADAENAVVEV
jgi:1,4-alpha-glucan branching enzyme